MAAPQGFADRSDPSSGARGRHPSAGRDGAVLAGAVRPVAVALARRGAPHPDVAAATIAVRGAQGRTRDRFAAAYGIAGSVLEALEAGTVAADRVPAPLRHLTPLRAVADHLARRG